MKGGGDNEEGAEKAVIASFVCGVEAEADAKATDDGVTLADSSRFAVLISSCCTNTLAAAVELINTGDGEEGSGGGSSDMLGGLPRGSVSSHKSRNHSVSPANPCACSCTTELLSVAGKPNEKREAVMQTRALHYCHLEC